MLQSFLVLSLGLLCVVAGCVSKFNWDYRKMEDRRVWGKSGGKDMEGLESGVFRWVGGLSPLGPLCVVS